MGVRDPQGHSSSLRTSVACFPELSFRGTERIFFKSCLWVVHALSYKMLSATYSLLENLVSSFDTTGFITWCSSLDQWACSCSFILMEDQIFSSYCFVGFKIITYALMLHSYLTKIRFLALHSDVDFCPFFQNLKYPKHSGYRFAVYYRYYTQKSRRLFLFWSTTKILRSKTVSNACNQIVFEGLESNVACGRR